MAVSRVVRALERERQRRSRRLTDAALDRAALRGAAMDAGKPLTGTSMTVQAMAQLWRYDQEAALRGVMGLSRMCLRARPWADRSAALAFATAMVCSRGYPLPHEVLSSTAAAARLWAAGGIDLDGLLALAGAEGVELSDGARNQLEWLHGHHGQDRDRFEAVAGWLGAGLDAGWVEHTARHMGRQVLEADTGGPGGHAGPVPPVR